MTPKFIKLTSVLLPGSIPVFLNANLIQAMERTADRTLLYEVGDSSPVFEVTETPSEILALIEKP